MDKIYELRLKLKRLYKWHAKLAKCYKDANLEFIPDFGPAKERHKIRLEHLKNGMDTTMLQIRKVELEIKNELNNL